MRNALRDRRIALGYTQEQVAMAIGYAGRASYGNIEKGIRTPSSGKLMKLERLMGMPAGILLEDIPSKEYHKQQGK